MHPHPIELHNSQLDVVKPGKCHSSLERQLFERHLVDEEQKLSIVLQGHLPRKIVPAENHREHVRIRQTLTIKASGVNLVRIM